VKSKAHILAEIQASRLAIARDAHGLVEELDFRKKIERTVRRRPFAWLGGAALAGFTFSALRRRPAPRPEPKRKGQPSIPAPAPGLTFWAFLLAAGKMILPAARPLLTAYATKRMAELAGHLGRK
jgi:hypothetical protein